MDIVAIVGRPNVGKSTLFNRLIGRRKAIVDDVSGITRDRQYGSVDWNGKYFTVIDTGGFVPNSEDIFESAIMEQIVIAMEEADIILFMVDVTTGITNIDQDMAKLLRRSEKDIFVIVNKVDNSSRLMEVNEFYRLGFKNNYFISSINGSGSGELLDAIAEKISEDVEDSTGENDTPKFAIVGQPNVGKSSLLNALIGEERNIVTEIPGTTRDTIHTLYKLYQKEFLLIDTAGIRKKAKVSENIEFYSVVRAIKAIEEADVCLIMIDATEGMEAQDMNIFRLAERRKKGVVILVNKWDLVNKETNTARDYEEELKEKLAPFSDVPIVFISALEKKRIFKVIDVAINVFKNKSQKIPTSKLNNVLLKSIEKYPPPSQKGRLIKIKYVTQLPSTTLTFAFFCNFPKLIKEPYSNYLENQLRQNFDISGVPVSIIFRKK